MIAYACNPEGSGEHWLGWGWAEQAAKQFDVTLITTPNAQDAILKHAEQKQIRPHFVAVPEIVKKISSFLGMAGIWLRKIVWQQRVWKLARDLHAQEQFQIVHQTTFHSFRVPFAAAGLGIPSVWGPIAGGETVPDGFYHFLGSAKWSERARKFINQIWLKVPSIQRSLRNASVIFLSNKSSLKFFPPEFHPKFLIVPANTVRPSENFSAQRQRKTGDAFHLLYVGNCVMTRAIPIVLHALLKANLTHAKLFIVGQGPAIPHWKNLMTRLGLNAQVDFVGQVASKELAAFYSDADALVFPALRDSGGSALLEAMSKSLPVICLDWGGPGEIVDEMSGIKIPVRDCAETVDLMAETFKKLEANPGLCRELGSHGFERAKNFTWENKRRLLEEIYHRLSP